MNGINQILIFEIKIKINKNKTKVLVCTKKEQTRQECIKINQENLGVKEFCYLGSKITWDGRSQIEINSRNIFFFFFKFIKKITIDKGRISPETSSLNKRSRVFFKDLYIFIYVFIYFA